MNVIEQVKHFNSLQTLQKMMQEARDLSVELSSGASDLVRITNDLEYQLRQRDSAYYFSEEKDPLQSISKVAINQDLVSEHFRDYFNCLLQFFKELAHVNGSFHNTHGTVLNSIVTKALRCLNFMAQIGTVGSFDFAKLFLQRNFLRTLLQAKVIDNDLLIEFDVWKRPDQSLSCNRVQELR